MISRSKTALLVAAAMSLYIVFNLCNWREKNMLKWDASGYYLYLPATIIYHDLAHLQFMPGMTWTYYLNDGNIWYEIYDQPTGRKIDKYPPGISVLQLPFFLAAHLYTVSTGSYPADGYSQPYLVCITFSIIFWVFVGLYFLRKLLLSYFSESATAITLLLITFGTNLYFYTFFSLGMSHPYSFGLFCCLLYATDRLYRTGKSKYFLAAGLALGLIAIVRPTNILVALLPLCWQYKDGRIGDKLAFYKSKLGAIGFATVLFAAVLMILLGYLKYTSGDWFHFSYQNESFHYLAPRIGEGLFSYRKGWFVYTPVALVAVLGLIPLARRYGRLALVTAIYILLNIYVVFSWHMWYYGGSFGCRPMIEAMAVMAIPLAALIQAVLARGKVVLNIIMFTVFGLMIALNAFQSYQLSKNVIMWDGTNRAFYWHMFWKLKVTDEDKKLLNE